MKIEKRKAYHLKTMEDAKEFLELCESQNIRWYTGKATQYNPYEEYKENTCICYDFGGDSLLGYANILYYKSKGIPIVEFKDNKSLLYNKIIFNPPATILFKDGKKYVAKCHPDDEFDEMIGLQVALLKSFSIKYKDLQELLKNAKRPKEKIKIEEVDVEDGKSYNPIEDLEDCFTYGIKMFKHAITSLPPKPKRGRPRKSSTTKTSKRRVGRPRKIKAEEPKVKRPVGRPRKIQNQKIEAGDFVLIKRDTPSSLEEVDKMLGRICEVKEVSDCYTYKIWQPDKKDWWWFHKRNIELVKKGDKNEK